MVKRASTPLFLVKALFHCEQLSQFHKWLGPKTKASNENHNLLIYTKVAPCNVYPELSAAATPHPTPSAGSFVTAREKIESNDCQRNIKMDFKKLI